MGNFIITLKRYGERAHQAIGPYSEEVAIQKAFEIRATKEFVRVHILPLSSDINEPAHG